MYEAPKFPQFMEEVLVRKRRWQQEDLGPTMEAVHYLCPSSENHAHWIVKTGESPRLTRCVMKKVNERPQEGHWIALERDLSDGLTLRRRIREKSTVKKIEGLEGDEEWKKEEGRRMMKKLIEEEMKHMTQDPEHLAVRSPS